MHKLAWFIALALLPGRGDAMEQQMNEKIAPARDGDVAIQEELCAARKKGTVGAYDLFIARHPKHPLAKVAKEERARIASRD